MKIDIEKRLHIGFSVAIILVLVVGIISFFTFRSQSDESDHVNHSYQVINRLEVIQKLLIDMETGRRGFRSTNEKTFLQPYYEGLQNLLPSLLQIDELVKDSYTQKQKVEVVKTRINDLLGFWRSLSDDASTYTKQDIIAVMTTEKNKMDGIRTIISSMIEEENKLLSENELINQRWVAIAKGALITGVILILIIVILLIVQILKEFRNRKIAEENLRQNYEQLTDLNQENAERNWLLAGVSKVNDLLQGHLESVQLTQVVLNTIIKYLDFKAGAFYLYNKETEKFNLTASYSLASTVKKEFGLHEGFLGQAAKEKEPMLVSDFHGSYHITETATMSLSPAQAIYTSLYRDKELIGVIEVLSFNKIDDKNLKFLKTIVNNISVALHSAQDREKVLQLLEQVQLQKEVLESQQEELRQTNEELTVQAEVLQASEEELRVQEEELRQINAEIQEKNKAVEAAGEALKVKARELEVASKYKSEFLANMSHELRTPLNSVLILAKLLSDNREKNLTEKQVTHAKIIHKSGSDLLELISDILDLSKIEAGKVDLFVEDVPVKNIVLSMEQLFTVVAEEKHINYAMVLKPGVPAVLKTDKQKVEQILKNLLSNAFKFTPADGKIQLIFEAVNENGVPCLAISVKDTGIGIAQSKQKDIFEAFQQADGATNRKFGGTGLGLSITKELLRLINGKIEVESVENEGSTFKITIPVELVKNREHAHANNRDNVEVKLPELADEIKDAKEQTKIPDDRNELVKEDKIMLIIEDDEVFASVIQDFALNNGYKTIVALTGDEGLLCARKYKPSAIILDLQLPGIDGNTLLHLFKKDPELKNTPVHIISGADDVKLSQTGALAFFKKPVEKEELEKAFRLIGEYLQATVKRILIISESELKEDIIKLIHHKNPDIICDSVQAISEAADKFKDQKYDCIIADIGADITGGIADLKWLNQQLAPVKIPTIIYLDKDITSNNEMELKKIGDVIVRKSLLSNNRLIDELELFLYKVQEKGKGSELKYNVANTTGESVLKNKNVLIVDDDMRNIFALSAALEQEKMNIIIANDGKEALDIIKRNKNLDIVLMDVMMPEMDGYDAMNNIRNTLKIKDLPIIALTAKAMAGDREKCIKAGASDYISKPVDTHKLISLMRVWLS